MESLLHRGSITNEVNGIMKQGLLPFKNEVEKETGRMKALIGWWIMDQRTACQFFELVV